MSGVDQGSMGSKELHYILRVLCPAACRNPELFKEVAASTLRVALPPPKRGIYILYFTDQKMLLIKSKVKGISRISETKYSCTKQI